MDDETKTNERIGNQRGFLPSRDPLPAFDIGNHTADVGEYLRQFDRLGSRLPDLLDTAEARPVVRSLEAPPPGILRELNNRETVRLCLLSGFFASAYVNQRGEGPVEMLPRGVAVPLYETSKKLGRKPILSYDLLCLHNFRRKDPTSAVTVDNLDVTQKFTHHDDETWFVIVHVAIEAAAEPAVTACWVAQQAIRDDDPRPLQDALNTISDSLRDQITIMQRMTEGNDTAVFANEFRPYYSGFEGVIYEGVDETERLPQTFRGGSGAQSSILPSIDATLGIDHETTAMTEKLEAMRSYMPPLHRSTIESLSEGPEVAQYITESDGHELRSAYNDCIQKLEEFREVHFEEVIQYIREETGDVRGTGGTNYMTYLQKMTEETESMKFV